MGAAVQSDYYIRPQWKNFNPSYLPYLNVSADTEIYYGGSSSGKSFFLAQRTILDILRGGHNYLCLRRYANTVTKSLFNELKKAINDLGVNGLFRVVPSQGHITCVNGYQILFTGMDDSEKVKSITPEKGVITDIWYEEATEGSLEEIKQLRKRLRGSSSYRGKKISKRVILSFNPIYKTHWIFKEFFEPVGWRDDQKKHDGGKRLQILKTTYKDNKFLTEQDVRMLEEESDPYWYNVYSLGNWGILGDAILTNWKTADLSGKIAEFDRVRNGLDFGYSADPNAFTRSHYAPREGRIYVFKGWHQNQLTNPMIAERLKPDIGEEAIFCDCAEPKSIQELQDAGIDARAVKKGPDSLLYSIKWLKKHEIIVDVRLQGLINELNTWQWKKDKDGNSLPIPEDKNNHYIDSIRYALEIEYNGFFVGVL